MGEAGGNGGALLGLFAVAEGLVDVRERSAVHGEFEEDLDTLLLDDGDVEDDGEVARKKRKGLLWEGGSAASAAVAKTEDSRPGLPSTRLGDRSSSGPCSPCGTTTERGRGAC